MLAIHAFMRAQNAGWEPDGEAGPSSGRANNQNDGNGMSRSQALEVLGLTADASAADISQAHKRLMQKLHPDRGGSSYLATQINLAKDTLLNS